MAESKKIAIVGCSDSKDLAPWDDKSWEIWGVNNLFISMKHEIDIKRMRWFEIHNITFDGKNFYRRGDLMFRGQIVNDYIKSLANLGCPIYMQKKWDQIPNSIEYPINEILQSMGGYFTNTISYEIALAIYEGATEIGIWGVDMAVGCLSPETRVLISDLRWVASGDIKVGDELMGFDEEPYNGNGKTRRWRKTIVTSAPEIEKPCYRIYFEDGTSIVASEKHGWLTHGENINRWKTTDELVTRYHRKGRPTRVLKLIDTWNENNSWETGYIAAAFDGEGWLSQNPRNDHIGSYSMSTGFSQRDNAMKDMVESILSKYRFDYGEQLVNGCYNHTIKGGKSEVMRLLGLFRPQRLLDKFNPEIVGELQSIRDVAVTHIEHIGMQTVIGLETESKTYIAEGFASHNSEYAHQRPSCEYFLGVAKGLGINIFVPAEADLLKTRFLYGFQEQEKTAWEKKVNKMMAAMHQRMIDAENQERQSFMKKQQYIGALEAAKELNKIWG